MGLLNPSGWQCGLNGKCTKGNVKDIAGCSFKLHTEVAYPHGCQRSDCQGDCSIGTAPLTVKAARAENSAVPHSVGWQHGMRDADITRGVAAYWDIPWSVVIVVSAV